MSTIPSLALIPSGVKASKVYSVLPTDGSGDFTFTRSGNATRVNSEGLIELVSSNVPRLNYPLIDGVVSGCPSLLLEPERTNLITNYTGSLFSAFNGASISANDSISPNGTVDATLITTTGNANELIQQSGITIVSGQSYTVSGYFKLKNGTLSDSDNGFKGLDGLNSVGVSGSTFNSTLTNEWKRLSFTVTSSTTSGRVQIKCEDAAEILVWGLQLELGSYVTSIIPTSGATATRSAETCNNAGDVNTFNDSEGVLFAEISGFSNTDASPKVFSLSDGSGSNRIICFLYNTEVVANIQKLGETPIDLRTDLGDVETPLKMGLKYKANDFALWINGFEIATSSSGQTYSEGTLDRLNFDSGFGIENFYGNTKQIQYFNTALSDEELALLTSL